MVFCKCSVLVPWTMSIFTSPAGAVAKYCN